MKKIIFIFITMLFICCTGPYKIYILFQNNTSDTIYCYVKRKHHREMKYTVDPGNDYKTGTTVKSKELKPSEAFNYIIIKDSLDQEIMNLSGPEFDEILILEGIKKYGKTYRLHVGDE